MSPLPPLVHLKPYLQPFPYGRLGLASLAAQYALAADPDGVKIDPEQPYGEVWIGGTHPNGAARVFGVDGTLREIIAADPVWYLGERVSAMKPYNGDLPFLFKVLSFDKALPLQAHPDRKLGAKLHEQDARKGGEDFVDSNHKPECCIALTPFQAFVGFRPLPELHSLLSSAPVLHGQLPAPLWSELQTNLEHTTSESTRKKAIRDVFAALIALDSDAVSRIVDAVDTAVTEEGDGAFGPIGERDGLAEVWRKNLKTYGKDVGLIVTTFMMNFLRLAPGEGAWILADDIHAYVEGECIECMANSDNMVAHGLGTEEMGGIKTFIDMLSYRHLPAPDLKLSQEDAWPRGTSGKTRLYKVPIAEFDLLRILLDAPCHEESLELSGPLEILVGEGAVRVQVRSGDREEELKLGRGGSAFVAAGQPVRFVATEERTEIWGAFVE